jgi:predicted RNase H-like HicB family nuclease
MQYVIVVEQGEHNWSAFAPDVDGCVATGATRAEAEQQLRSALAFHFEGLTHDRAPLPAPGTWTTVVDVAIPAGARFARRIDRVQASSH